jgi:hypothetical protein
MARLRPYPLRWAGLYARFDWNRTSSSSALRRVRDQAETSWAPVLGVSERAGRLW